MLRTVVNNIPVSSELMEAVLRLQTVSQSTVQEKLLDGYLIFKQKDHARCLRVRMRGQLTTAVKFYHLLALRLLGIKCLCYLTPNPYIEVLTPV